MFLIDTQNKKAISLEKKSFSELKLSERKDLQEWITSNPKILGENLLIIQKEFGGFSETNERLDLLALDENGRLVVIENKLDDSGRDVVWQALKYVSYCATLTKTQICDIYQTYLNSIGSSGSAKEMIADFYDQQDIESVHLNVVEGDQRIILVAAHFRKEVTSTVLWLRNYHSVDITCIKVAPYKDGEKLYLDVVQIIPIQDAQDYQIRLTAKKQEETILNEAGRHKLRRSFWEQAIPALREKTGIYNNVSILRDDNWVYGATGYSNIHYNTIILKDGARVELFISTNTASRNKEIFNKLKNKVGNAQILGKNIDWRELPEKRASCISLHYQDYGLNDIDNWHDIITFMTDGLAGLKNVLQPLLDDVMKNNN